jgi:hypothetical protein
MKSIVALVDSPYDKLAFKAMYGPPEAYHLSLCCHAFLLCFMHGKNGQMPSF